MNLRRMTTQYVQNFTFVEALQIGTISRFVFSVIISSSLAKVRIPDFYVHNFLVSKYRKKHRYKPVQLYYSQCKQINAFISRQLLTNVRVRSVITILRYGFHKLIIDRSKLFIVTLQSLNLIPPMKSLFSVIEQNLWVNNRIQLC